MTRAGGIGRDAAARTVLQFAMTGAISGALVTLAIFIPQWFGFYDALEANFRDGAFKLNFSPLSILPGLVFGLLAGRLLAMRGMLAARRYWAYVAVSTLSYFVTVQVTLDLFIDLTDNMFTVGIAAGALGAALLTAATALLSAVPLRPRSAAAMILAGAVFGAGLYIPLGWNHFIGWLLLFAPWQSAYASAMATALDR